MLFWYSEKSQKMKKTHCRLRYSSPAIYWIWRGQPDNTESIWGGGCEIWETGGHGTGWAWDEMSQPLKIRWQLGTLARRRRRGCCGEEKMTKGGLSALAMRKEDGSYHHSGTGHWTQSVCILQAVVWGEEKCRVAYYGRYVAFILSGMRLEEREILEALSPIRRSHDHWPLCMCSILTKYWLKFLKRISCSLKKLWNKLEEERTLATEIELVCSIGMKNSLFYVKNSEEACH